MIVRLIWRTVCLRVHRASDTGSHHFFDFGRIEESTKIVTFAQENCRQRKYNINYSMVKV